MKFENYKLTLQDDYVIVISIPEGDSLSMHIKDKLHDLYGELIHFKSVELL